MHYLFYLTLFLFLFGQALLYNNIDNDFFARLIVGKTYFQTGSLLNWDFLSYTPTHRFIDHEWGSSLIFYFLQSNFGDIGLLIFKTIIYFGTFFLITKIILLHNKNAKLNILPFVLIINTIANLLFSTIRCQSFTFFFFVLWLYVLEKVRLENHTRLLWILPATMLIWGNLHGGCASGIGLLILYIAGEFLNKKPVKKYFLTLLFCLLTLLINPYGLEYLKFLFSALTLKRELITEWQPVFSTFGIEKCVKFVIYLFAFLAFFIAYQLKFKPNINKVNKTKAIVILITLIMSIKSIRLEPFFIFSTLAFCYNDFYKIFSKEIPVKLNKIKEIFLFIIMLLFAISSVYTKKLSCVAWEYPVLEVDFLKQNNIKGNILCEFHDGSYVAYKLYPNNLIFMDGKYEEVYPNNLIYVLKNLNLSKDGWQKYLDIYPTDILIISKKYKIFKEIQTDKRFKLTMQSPQYALFLRKELVKKNFKPPTAKGKYYIETKFETNIDWSTK